MMACLSLVELHSQGQSRKGVPSRSPYRVDVTNSSPVYGSATCVNLLSSQAYPLRLLCPASMLPFADQDSMFAVVRTMLLQLPTMGKLVQDLLEL